MRSNMISREGRFVMSKELRQPGCIPLFSMSDSRSSNSLRFLGSETDLSDRTESNNQNTYQYESTVNTMGRSEVGSVVLHCLKLRGYIKLTVLGTVKPKRGRIWQSESLPYSDYLRVRRGVS